MDLWRQILQKLESQITAESYENWLEPVVFSHLDEQGRLYLRAPDENSREWLQAEFEEVVLKAAGDLNLDVRSVVFLAESEKQANGESTRRSPAQTSFDFNAPPTVFNSKYTFDTFVVGACNEFAHAAARAVTTNPAKAYNPLYIYGGVGMGKTHLMHAIGQQLRSNFRDLQVVYVSGEDFMNEMINSLRYQGMSAFRERYRSADALLVDDIQILGAKERTQEEFFHTFNSLHNMQKQIVISCDRPPKLVPGLVDRLRSRFEWGLLADIQAPDLETKMAILDRKAEEYAIHLSDEVRLYLATHLKSNMRELEGALIRLMAISSFSASEITLQMTKQTLYSVMASEKSRITFEALQRAVGEEFGLEPKRLREKNNSRAIAFPRQIAMYLAKQLMDASLPDIGRAFGGKHHTTVLHAVNKIERLRQSNPDINRQIHKLTDRFN